MDRLRAIGFELIGHWFSENKELKLELNKSASQKNALYAFAIDDEVKYIGKTTRTIAERMYGYKKPSETQRTNIKNNANILSSISQDEVVDIYVLPDNGLMHYGVFHLNLAAGLEDSLIKTVNPEWNGRQTNHFASEELEAPKIERAEVAPKIKKQFQLILHPTYYEKGFFNVPILESKLFGDDGENIEIYLGKYSDPVVGVINRKANSNGTPRIMGGRALREWIRQNYKELESLRISIFSPCSIRLG